MTGVLLLISGMLLVVIADCLRVAAEKASPGWPLGNDYWKSARLYAMAFVVALVGISSILYGSWLLFCVAVQAAGGG